MRTLKTASCTLIALVALASATVGCHRKEPVAVDSTVTTTVPATPTTTGTDSTASTASTSSTASTGSGMSGATGSGTAAHGTRVDDKAHGATTTAAHPMDGVKPGVKNNTGQTQGTSPTSLPTSDGSR